MRPVIGITGRRKKAGQIAGMIESMQDYDVSLFIEAYWRAIIAAGGLPVGLSLDLPAAESAPALDGILLTGGSDVDPARYGQEAHESTDTPDPVRDEHELGLLEEAHRLDIPVLCICRGIQIANVHFGGTLTQDLPPHGRFDAPAETVHEVEFTPSSTLAELYGDSAQVNSLHHQALDELGTGLRVTSRSHDGTIEGIESDDMTLLGVQWHPEMLPTAPVDPVFGWLIEQATARRGASV